MTVNDYVLKNFVASKNFTYAAQKSYKNLVDGANTYHVVFSGRGKTLDEESIVVYASSDKNALAAMKTQWEKDNTPPPTVTIPTQTATQLDPKKLYKDSRPLTMKILLQSDIPLLQNVQQTLVTKLEASGVTTQTVSMSANDIQKNLANPDFSYDIAITGINLGLFHYDILPFFHSGLTRGGYNITRTRNATLDTLTERMTDRLYYSIPDKLRSLQTSVEKIIEQDALLFSLGSPYEFLFAKESVIGLHVPAFLPGRAALMEILSDTYLKQGYKRSDEPKTVFGFFAWLKNELFPST